jgi:Ca2+-binding RTX toxin-like protein
MLNRWNAGRLVKAGLPWNEEQAADRVDAPWRPVTPLAVINGTPGDDTLVGTSGADTIDGGAGADQMSGLKGADTYIVDNVGDRVVEAAGGGKDTVKASVSHTLADNVENLVLTGTAALSGTGNALANKLTGNAGSNLLDGLGGADTMVGGKGNDTYRVDNAGDVVTEKAGQGIDTVSTSVDYTLGAGVENLTMSSGGTAGIKGYGNELANTMSDWIGSDLLSGLDGNDTLNGGTVLGPNSSDTLDGGQGNDVLNAGRYNYSSDKLYGGEGNDTLTVKAGSNSLYGDGGDDLLVSGSGGLYSSSDYLDGGAGIDTLQGGGGLSGGDGDDLMTTNAFTASASGGEGNDSISGTGGAGYSNLWVDGGGGHDSIDSFALNNHLNVYGGDGNDTIEGGAQMNVRIEAGTGDDVVTAYRATGAPGEVTVLAGDGNDAVSATNYNGDCTVDGGIGDDVLSGRTNQGSVTVDGGAGNDTLSSAHGMAALTGGDGSDLFVLSAKQVLHTDEVWTTDFTSGADHLGISQATLAVGNGDLYADGAVTVEGPGGFENSAELVIVAADIFGDITLENAAAAIGSANESYEAGQTVLFVVDNGTNSEVLYFTSSGKDAEVSASELTVVGTLLNTASTSAEDIVWTA